MPRVSRPVLPGERFNRLTLVSLDHRDRDKKPYWLCQCDCGDTKVIALRHLQSGGTKSCGCYHSDALRSRATHGHTTNGRKTSTYLSWREMFVRCYRKTSSEFKNYGARGITVCDRWKTFEVFFSDMGEKPTPKHSIDRYPDNNGNYEPGNCRWATSTEQNRNRRSNRYVTAFGRTQLLTDWSKEFGIPMNRLGSRLDRGWEPERAITQPPAAWAVRRSAS